MEEVNVRAGQKDVKCKMRQTALGDMDVCAKRYYELNWTIPEAVVEATQALALPGRCKAS